MKSSASLVHHGTVGCAMVTNLQELTIAGSVGGKCLLHKLILKSYSNNTSRCVLRMGRLCLFLVETMRIKR